MSKSKYLPTLNIINNEKKFKNIIDLSIFYIKKINGISDAKIEISENLGFSLSVRNNKIEKVEKSKDKYFNITIYYGSRFGCASTSDFSKKTILDTIKKACYIAYHTNKDNFICLPNYEDLAFDYPELNLHNPCNISIKEASNYALNSESSIISSYKNIAKSDGTTFCMYEGFFLAANTKGFIGGYPYSRYIISTLPIVKYKGIMQRDYWYSSSRYKQGITNPFKIGLYALNRTLSRIKTKKIYNGIFSILLEPQISLELLNSFINSISGSSIYKKSSFLTNSIEKRVFSKHIQIEENPHILGGICSAPFDDEFVKTKKKHIVENGILKSYLLSTYTAKKLNMRTTGNSGGLHNLIFTSSLTRPGDNFQNMLYKLYNGIIITETMGQGVNYINGDYSKGAFGYWVKNGEIKYPIENITIAGNLKDIFKKILHVGSDFITICSKTIGSIIIENMFISGR